MNLEEWDTLDFNISGFDDSEVPLGSAKMIENFMVNNEINISLIKLLCSGDYDEGLSGEWEEYFFVININNKAYFKPLILIMKKDNEITHMHISDDFKFKKLNKLNYLYIGTTESIFEITEVAHINSNKEDIRRICPELVDNFDK